MFLDTLMQITGIENLEELKQLSWTRTTIKYLLRCCGRRRGRTNFVFALPSIHSKMLSRLSLISLTFTNPFYLCLENFSCFFFIISSSLLVVSDNLKISLVRTCSAHSFLHLHQQNSISLSKLSRVHFHIGG